MKRNPDFSLENESGYALVAGCDEAGRGPLCGPVIAAAVVFPNRNIKIPIIIRDSKKMTRAQRSVAYKWICRHAIWAVAGCDVDEIDKINILWASMLAMKRAVKKLSIKPEFCLVDGNKMPRGLVGSSIIKGDEKSISIAAASIIAKETRDKIMFELSLKYPQYKWEKNVGYSTAEHLQAIRKYGINQHYRKSFKPVKEIIKNETSHN